MSPKAAYTRPSGLWFVPAGSSEPKFVLAETAGLHGLSAEEIADERHVDGYQLSVSPRSLRR